ncbi:MAG: urease-associated protein [Bacteroidetes bacterium]|nr:urease-associated protein [Bacteroidota bacterium]
MIKTFFRYFFRALLGIIAFLVLWLAFAFFLPYVHNGYGPLRENKSITVYIESNGVHTDFVMPVKTMQWDWSKKLAYSDFEMAGPSYEYVAVGWGDKGFFIGTPTWADLKFSTAFNAAFGLSTTAMHVTYKRFQPKENEQCRRIELSALQYRILVNYIRSSFQAKEGKFIAIDHPGYSEHDCFYEANGTYSLFNTCNVWTGNGLRCIGVSTGTWTPLAGGVLQGVE